MAIGSVTYGYCSSIIGTTLGQPSFIAYFSLDTRSDADGITGAFNGLFQAGGLLGALSMTLLADRLGRRKTILAGAIAVVIGSALQTGSVNVGMFMAARLITGFGIGKLLHSDQESHRREPLLIILDRQSCYDGPPMAGRGCSPAFARVPCWNARLEKPLPSCYKSVCSQRHQVSSFSAATRLPVGWVSRSLSFTPVERSGESP